MGCFLAGGRFAKAAAADAASLRQTRRVECTGILHATALNLWQDWGSDCALALPGQDDQRAKRPDDQSIGASDASTGRGRTPADRRRGATEVGMPLDS